MIIGITGGIGCGKSTVCNLLIERYKAVHYNADLRVKELYVSNKTLFELIYKEFPESIEHNQIIFKKLGEIVFSDVSKLSKLNQIIAPFIITDFKSWVSKNENNYNIILLESAILINSELIQSCDLILYIYASENVRKKRIQERDKRSTEQIESILKIQGNIEDYVSKSNYIINNSYNSNYLSEQVDKLYYFLKKKS
jgi:dephospho-CoA kinase